MTLPGRRDHHASALGVTGRACQDLGSLVMLAQETSGNGARCQPQFGVSVGAGR
jgi:hypothetical protein